MTITIRRMLHGPPSPAKVNPAPRVLASVWLPIELAALCLDLQCGAVFALGNDSCPACGGRAQETLSAWLSGHRRKKATT